MRGKATRGRKRMHLLSGLMKAKYVALKITAEDRKEWKKLLRAGSHTSAGMMQLLSACHCTNVSDE